MRKQCKVCKNFGKGNKCFFCCNIMCKKCRRTSHIDSHGANVYICIECAYFDSSKIHFISTDYRRHECRPCYFCNVRCRCNGVGYQCTCNMWCWVCTGCYKKVCNRCFLKCTSCCRIQCKDCMYALKDNAVDKKKCKFCY